jgi:hypothetical protein
MFSKGKTITVSGLLCARTTEIKAHKNKSIKKIFRINLLLEGKAAGAGDRLNFDYKNTVALLPDTLIVIVLRLRFPTKTKNSLVLQANSLAV